MGNRPSSSFEMNDHLVRISIIRLQKAILFLYMLVFQDLKNFIVCACV